MNNLTRFQENFRDWVLESVYLEPEHYEQAISVSKTVTGTDEQWQMYLNTLALLGFEQWLIDRQISIDYKQATLWKPQYNQVIKAVCNISLANFKGCLIATENLIDGVAIIPKAALDLSAFAAHFYVLIEVLEEQEEIIIRGFIRADKLADYRQQKELINVDEWNYEIPLYWFDEEPNHLLSDIHSLYPSDIVLTVPQTLSKVSTLQEKITLFTEPAFNIVSWIKGEVDAIAHNFGAYALPLPNHAGSTVISSQQKFGQAILRLQTRVGMPDNVYPIYNDSLNLDGYSLRLCTINWLTNITDTWSLLVILGTQTGEPLPLNIQLKISSLNKSQDCVVTDNQQAFLYAKIQGNLGEKFLITVISPSGISVSLPPYTVEL